MNACMQVGKHARRRQTCNARGARQAGRQSRRKTDRGAGRHEGELEGIFFLALPPADRRFTVTIVIGLYRENNIAIQNESGDSNGGNV